MSESRVQFEKAFPVPAHWIEFNEKRNKYYCPYVADAKADEYQAKWEVWQERQSEIDQLKKQLNTANISKKGDDSTIENATKVMEEMRGQIQKLQKERDQLKAEKAGLEKLIKDWRKSANWMCATDDKHVINSLRSCADDLEKALRGDS